MNWSAARRATPRLHGTDWSARAGLALLLVAIGSMIACGKKGPPLPPLLKVPTPPPDFLAERRGNEIKMQLTIPSTNADGSRPANIDRIEIYGFTGSFTANDDQLVKLGTRVASVSVKSPKNPDVTTEADEPPEEPDLNEDGLDQGAIAQFEEPLTQAAFTRVELPKDKTAPPVSRTVPVDGPLLGPPNVVPWRIFVAVGVNTRGKKGGASKRAIVPLVPPPAPPSAPVISYDEKAITLSWQPSTSSSPIQGLPPTGSTLLPARFFGMDLPTMEYHVYDVSPSLSDGRTPAGPAALPGEVRLTMGPIPATSYQDNRMDWGTTRCYTVRAFETVTGQTLQSDAPPPSCVTLKDTFAPAAPVKLQHIAAEGVINLIWEPNGEADLAGYLVLRGTPGGVLQPVTPAPIAATVYEDKVPSGTTYSYAVQAVDRSGNISPPSMTVEDVAR